MNNDPRVDRKIKSILSLMAVLNEAIRDPKGLARNESLCNSLKSQSNLAKYNNPTKGIESISLNTLKRVSNNHIEGGYAAVDQLRLTALNILNKTIATYNKPSKQTRSVIINRNKELEQDKQQLLHDLLLLTHVIRLSFKQARNYANMSQSDVVIALCKKEQTELLKKLSIQKNRSLLESSNAE